MKFLLVLSFAVCLFLVGCKGESNTNTNVATTPTAVPKTSETAATDTATVKKIEDALKAKGFTDVKVDGTTKPITIRGTVPKGKLDEAVKAAQDAAGTPVKNEITEK
jgi:PBP1b-binding outer membrane lipoprotein LpoB